MVELDKSNVKKYRIRSMRKPRRVLLSLGICGSMVGIGMIVIAASNADRKFILIGLIYTLISLFFIGLGEMLAGISRVKKNSARRKNSIE